MLGPRPIGTPPRTIEITGHCFPWSDGQPVFASMLATSDLFLPVFSTIDKLRTMMATANIPYQSIKHIDDQRAFLDSLPSRFGDQRLRVIVDPYFTKGRVRFVEIMRDDNSG